MKYETARTWRFNLHIILASSIVTSCLAIYEAWGRVPQQMAAWQREHFVNWVEAWVRWRITPGRSLTQGDAADLILRVHDQPAIEAEFHLALEKIFIHAPAYAIAITLVTFILIHAVAGYIKQNKGEQK